MSTVGRQNKDYIITSVLDFKGLATEYLISFFKVKFIELLNLTGLSPALATILALQAWYYVLLAARLIVGSLVVGSSDFDPRNYD